MEIPQNPSEKRYLSAKSKEQGTVHLCQNCYDFFVGKKATFIQKSNFYRLIYSVFSKTVGMSFLQRNLMIRFLEL